MKLSSVLELKDYLVTQRRKTNSELGTADAALRWRNLKAADKSRVPVAGTSGIGLGATYDKRGWVLAVRVQEKGLLYSPLVEAITKKACGEVEIRYTGPVRSVGYRPAPHGKLWQRTRRRHLEIGVSVGHPLVTAGTLGALVLHKSRKGWFILSNNHVLAAVNAASVGDDLLQPGVVDGGHGPADVAAQLAAFEELELQGVNEMDAAIAAVSEGIEVVPGRIYRVGPLGPMRMAPAEIGMKVRKMGRTTGLTSGCITAVAMDDIDVKMGSAVASFDNQIEIESASGRAPFCEGGDSGSLIIDDERQPTALLFAGSDGGGRGNRGLTYAHPIGPVMDRLGIVFPV